MRPSTFLGILIIATLFGFLVGRWTAPAPYSATPASSEFLATNEFSVRVSEVVDGDTLIVQDVGQRFPANRVRLLGIDTPERGQSGYVEAKQLLYELVHRGEVRLLVDRSENPQRDRYGRLLALIIVDSTKVNVEMVRAGWSAYVPKFGGEVWAKEFVAAEEEARTAKRGIWANR